MAVVEQHTADDLSVAPGTTVEALGIGTPAPLDVVGVGLSPEYLLPAQSQQQVVTTPGSFAVLFVPESVVESLGGRGDRAPGARRGTRRVPIARTSTPG